MEIATKATPTVPKTSTLGKSRKKKAAPPPPVQQTKVCSMEAKTSPAKTKKKAKKPPQDEFMAFKVKVISMQHEEGGFSKLKLVFLLESSKYPDIANTCVPRV